MTDTQPANEAGSVTDALQRIADDFITATLARSQRLPVTDYDSQWPSECIQSIHGEQAEWRPVRRNNTNVFKGIEDALEIKIPQTLKAYFGYFWSLGIPVSWGDRTFELLFLWNAQDEDNLLHNFLGHILQKKRARETATLFFAVVDEARFLSVDVESGAIVLEELGQKSPQEVCPSLDALLMQCNVIES